MLTRKAPMKRTAMKPYRWKPAVPAEVRELLIVVYRGVLSYLTNDGKVLDYFETNAAALFRSDSTPEAVDG